MPELKPCPFCGKDAQIAPDEIGSGGQHVPPYHAGCFRGAGCGIAFTADDPDEAIAEWNRRSALSTATPAEVGGLGIVPVGFMRTKDIQHLAEMHSGATSIQIANLAFGGWTEPVYAATALESAETALAEARKALDRMVALYESEYDPDFLPARPAWLQEVITARRALTGGQDG